MHVYFSATSRIYVCIYIFFLLLFISRYKLPVILFTFFIKKSFFFFFVAVFTVFTAATLFGSGCNLSLETQSQKLWAYQKPAV